MTEPRPTDILCGKSRDCLQAPGSIRFRNFIDTYTDQYIACTTKYSKMMITKEIYEIVSQQSRFLKFNSKTQEWEEISVMAGRDKIGHALRFSSRATRRKEKTESKPPKTHRRSGSTSSAVSTTSTDSASTNANAVGWEALAGHVRVASMADSIPLERVVSSGLAAELASELASNYEFAMTAGQLEMLLEEVAEDVLVESTSAHTPITPTDEELPAVAQIIRKVSKMAVTPAHQPTITCRALTEEQEHEDGALLDLLSAPVGDWDHDFAEDDFAINMEDFHRPFHLSS